MGILPLQNNPQTLDLSYKTDLNFRDRYGSEKNHLTAEVCKTNLDIGVFFEDENPFYSQKNMALHTSKLCILK